MAKTKVVGKVVEREEALVPRTYDVMISEALRQMLEAKSLTGKEVNLLIDSLGLEDTTAKALAERVKVGKAVLLEYAKGKKLRKLFGDDYEAPVSDSTKSTIKASKAIKIMEKEGKLKLFDSVLTVGVENFKKYLGSDLYDKNIMKTTELFASISIKKKKGEIKEKE